MIREILGTKKRDEFLYLVLQGLKFCALRYGNYLTGIGTTYGFHGISVGHNELIP